MKINNQKPEKMSVVILALLWINTVFFSLLTLIFLFYKPIVAIGSLIVAFCSCPKSIKIFKNKKNLQFVCILLSFILFIKIIFSIADTSKETKTDITTTITSEIAISYERRI
mgnify:CR=1 FL=1